MSDKFQSRKTARLKEYDYRQNGMYFITICTNEKKCTLSKIIYDRRDNPCGCPKIMLSDLGIICEKTFMTIEAKYQINIENYAVMPNHIHIILETYNRALRTGASPVPTVSDIVGAYKSIVSTEWLKQCKQNNVQMGNLWQHGFYDHIIRDDEDLFFRQRYINENPLRWCLRQNNQVT